MKKGVRLSTKKSSVNAIQNLQAERSTHLKQLHELRQDIALLRHTLAALGDTVEELHGHSMQVVELVAAVLEERKYQQRFGGFSSKDILEAVESLSDSARDALASVLEYRSRVSADSYD